MIAKTKKAAKSINVNVKNMVKWFTESEQTDFKGEPIPTVEELARRVKVLKIAIWHADLQKRYWERLDEKDGHPDTLEEVWWTAIK